MGSVWICGFSEPRSEPRASSCAFAASKSRKVDCSFSVASGVFTMCEAMDPLAHWMGWMVLKIMKKSNDCGCIHI